MKTAVQFCVSLFALLFCSGCATSALWEEGQFSRFRAPCTPSNLQLFKSVDEQKVLIVYDEENEDHKARKRRAYWADTMVAARTSAQRPHFVSTNVANTLSPIPLGPNPSNERLWATPELNSQAFVLFRDGTRVGLYMLPEYDDNSGRLKQFALTPLAVAADVSIVGGIAAVNAAGWYAGGSGVWIPGSSETK